MNWGLHSENCVQRPSLPVIQQKDEEKLKTASIYINQSNVYFYGNNLRKTMIQSCIKKGFKNVIFLEPQYIAYFVAMKFSYYIPKNGDIIWVFSGDGCFVYQRIKDKAKFICQCDEDYSKNDVLKDISNKSKFIPNNCLFYSDDEKISKEMVTKIFPLCKCHVLVSTLAMLRSESDFEVPPWNCQTIVKFALIKADLVLQKRLKCESYDLLNRNIFVEYGGHKIIKLVKFQTLPLKVFYKVTKVNGSSDIYVDEEEKRIFGIKKYNSYKVPENIKNFYIFFKVDSNGIYSIRNLSSPIISISGNAVTIYDIQNEAITFFKTATDYGFDEPIMNVSYNSLTTLNDPLKYFERECVNGNISVKRSHFCLPLEDTVDYFYIIDIDGREKPVSTKRIIIDVIKYAINKYTISTDFCIVTYPPHFTDAQKRTFMECFENAGLKDSTFVDEQIALAYGCEKEYDMSSSSSAELFYIIVHYSDPKICISLFEFGVDYEKEYERILLEAEDFDSMKNEFFDAIIDNDNSINNNFEEMLDTCLLSIKNLLETKTIQRIFVTRKSSLFTIISDFFPETCVTFIQCPEKFITKGALFCYDIPENIYMD